MVLTSLTLRSALVILLLVFTVVEQASPQTEPSIEILEPSAWATTAVRGLTVVGRESVKVRGIASHPQGVRAVLLNGRRAALRPTAPNRWEFNGFVSPGEGDQEVLIRVEPNLGEALTRSYPLTVDTEGLGLGLRARERRGFAGERWAVVIGISNYQDPSIPDLAYADDDARAFYEFLRSPVAGLDGFKEENIRLLINEDATYQGIREALFTFLKAPTDDDVVVVYFAGHGAPDLDRPDNHYLLAHDSRAGDVSSTGFPMDDVQDAISQTYHKHLVFITDACHSAGVGTLSASRSLESNPINQVFLERLESSRAGYVIFTASQINQRSQEDDRWGGGHGVFTHFLLDGLNGAADEDDDQIVTLGEITEYARDRVRRETRNAQIPTISQTAFDAYLPLAVVPARVAEPEVPIEEEEVGPRPPDAGKQPPAEIEGLGTAARMRFNPAAEAVKSLVIPGLGQMSTGRHGPGVGLLASFAGALGIGLFVTSTEVQCLSPSPNDCPAEDIYSKTVERPYLDVSVGAALAISIFAAWDARRGAVRANEKSLSSSDVGSNTLQLRPRVNRSRDGRLSVEWMRVRF